MNPSDSRCALPRFRFLIRSSRWSPHPAPRVSSTGQCVFLSMPSLLPRESTCAISVLTTHVQRPSPFDHRVGFSISFTRLPIGSLALRPAILLFRNSRPWIAPAPLPHATKAYGQLLGRDFNPLDTLLLLRTVNSSNVAFRNFLPHTSVTTPLYFQSVLIFAACTIATMSESKGPRSIIFSSSATCRRDRWSRPVLRL